jgi:hypothetical protein
VIRYSKADFQVGKATDKDFSTRFASRLDRLIRARFGEGHGWKARAARETKTGAQLVRYLAGTAPGADKLLAIAQGLGCTVTELLDFDGPIPEFHASDEARPSGTDKPASMEGGPEADFDFYGPRWKMSERGLARFTDTAEKVEAFVTALIRSGAPIPDIERLGLHGLDPPKKPRRAKP